MGIGLIRSRPSILFVALFLALAAACVSRVTTTLVDPARAETLDGRSAYLKAHLSSGSVYVLSDWQVDSAELVVRGRGSLLDLNRQIVSEGAFDFPFDSVALFETNVVEPSGASKALTVMAGITAGVAGICALSPKTCFGSCPTFYAPGMDGGLVLQAEGFSSSVAPALEATDVDMLLHAGSLERDYRVRVTNEALETHVIRRADLLVVPRPPRGRIYLTSSGRYREAWDGRPPTRCTAAEGDCLPGLLVADGSERASVADPTDLAAREIIELEFDDPSGAELGLVFVTRQTLLTTFLFYQTLAYMGREATSWLASLERNDDAKRRLEALERVLGQVEVLTRGTDGVWRVVGSVGETGPIAQDSRVVSLPTPAKGPLRVRLRMTKGLWRLDQVELVSLGRELEPMRIEPVGVKRAGTDDPEALAALRDPARTLVTLPGDELEVSYRLPEEPWRYELFLESSGYYLEWMREEWLAEEDPLMAARMLFDPAAALRALAPAFKEQEADIERLFWGSRYARN